MAGKKRRKLLVPESREQVDQLQTEIMKKKLEKKISSPQEAKVELAKQWEVPFYDANPQLKAKEAGKIGGEMGGSLVKELVRRAKRTLAGKENS